MGDKKHKWWNSWQLKGDVQQVDNIEKAHCETEEAYLKTEEIKSTVLEGLRLDECSSKPILSFKVVNEKITQVNDYFEEWSGYSRNELLKEKLDLFSNLPERYKTLIKNEKNSLEFDLMMNVVKKDKTISPVHWVVTTTEKGQLWVGLPANHTFNVIQNNLKQIEMQNAFVEINRTILKSGNFKEILSMVVKNAVEMVERATHGSIMVLDHNQYLKVFSTWGYGEEMLTQFKVPLVSSYLYHATQGKLNKASVIVHPGYENIYTGTDVLVDYVSEQDFYYESTYLASTISAPLEINGAFYGCINLDTTNDHGFTAFDLWVLEKLREQVNLVLENYQHFEQTAYLSKYDKLTDVCNRGYFEEQIGQMMMLETPFLLVIFDLSHLKHVNDTYGHHMGDAYLKQFSKTLKTYFGMGVLLGRYGGDEFVGVFTGIERNELIRIIEVLYILFEKEPLIVQRGAPLVCKFHYGITEFPEEGTQLQELVSKAEKKLAIQRNQEI